MFSSRLVKRFVCNTLKFVWTETEQRNLSLSAIPKSAWRNWQNHNSILRSRWPVLKLRFEPRALQKQSGSANDWGATIGDFAAMWLHSGSYVCTSHSSYLCHRLTTDFLRPCLEQVLPCNFIQVFNYDCVSGLSVWSPEMDRRFRFKPWTGFLEINAFACKWPS